MLIGRLTIRAFLLKYELELAFYVCVRVSAGIRAFFDLLLAVVPSSAGVAEAESDLDA